MPVLTMPLLGEPFRVGGLTLPNRIVIAPMCQYASWEGVAQPWHWQHLGALAVSGAGLVIVEATAVEANGRISLGDAGLWNDTQEETLTRLIQDLRTFSSVPMGIQLAHAGRKASTKAPFAGGSPLTAGEGAWPTLAPSAVPFDQGWHTPEAMGEADMERVLAAFVASARRADRAGFDLLELHGAHGYLLSEFLSPLSNRREDAFGGSFENRLRYPLMVAAAVRAVWPRSKAVGVRLNGSDWTDGGVTPDETANVARRLKDLGIDYVHVTSGGNIAQARIPGREPGYQVEFAAHVKRRTPDLPVIAVGMINSGRQAEAILAAQKADLIGVARAVLDDPRWPLRALTSVGADPPYPPPYERAAPRLWPGYRFSHPEQIE